MCLAALLKYEDYERVLLDDLYFVSSSQYSVNFVRAQLIVPQNTCLEKDEVFTHTPSEVYHIKLQDFEM